MKITETELKKLESCTSDQQWNAECNKIKEVRGGQYPTDWYQMVILSGLLPKARPNAGIKVTCF